jgi:predicted O-methyltransferase YrrM
MALLFTLVAAIAVLALLALQLHTLRKIRRIDINTWDRSRHIFPALDNLFQQWESLLALYTDLRLERSLPRTRSWAGSPDFLSTLVREVQLSHPQIVVECSSGVSTVVLARALQLNGRGHVFSLEHEALYAEKTRQELARHGLSDWATVIDAPLAPCATDLGEKPWYTTQALPDQAIDMVVIDGPPETTAPLARYPAGPILFPRLADQASVFLDDANRPAEREAVEHWLKRFPQLGLTQAPCEKGLAILRKPLAA